MKGGGPLRGGIAEGFAGTTGSQPLPYEVMTVEQICTLQIPAEAHAHMYLWTTSGFC